MSKRQSPPRDSSLPSSNDNSPGSNMEQTTTHDNSATPPPHPAFSRTTTDSSPSPISPAVTTSGGHGRIASTSTTASRPEGYPSWLPRRPPPPAPASTFHSRPSTSAEVDYRDSMVGTPEGDMYSDAPRDSEEITTTPAAVPRPPELTIPIPETGSTLTTPQTPGGERKPTPRSVRIVSLPGQPPSAIPAPSRDASDSTKVGPVSAGPGAGHYRGFSRATPSSAISPTMFGSGVPPSAVPRPYSTMTMHQRPAVTLPPRFRTPKFHPTLLSSPSAWSRLRFALWGIFVVFAPLVVQTFLDFNIAYMLIQVAIHPTPAFASNGNASSAKNWTLATAAYVACWALWLLGVFLAYEVIFCFWRRWRVKRPLLTPIYLSAPAFNFVSMTSYANFCFLQHIRLSALDPSWDDDSLPDPDLVSESPEPITAEEVEERKQSIEKPVERHRRNYSHTRTISHPVSHSSEGHPPMSELDARPSDVDRPQSAVPISNPPAVKPAHGSSLPLRRHHRKRSLNWRQFIAESCWFYSQNTPTVVLLLPRLALSLALLLALSSPPASAIANGLGRDATFFRSAGQLSTYARAVIWINLAWGAWRILVLFFSWLGLWILSGQGCAGICGPRFRWEENTVFDDELSALPPQMSEKRGSLSYSVYEAQQFNNARSHAFADPDDHTLNWPWMEDTRERIWSVWEFCLTGGSSSTRPPGPTDGFAKRFSSSFNSRALAGSDRRGKYMSDVGYGYHQKPLLRPFSMPTSPGSAYPAFTPLTVTGTGAGLGFSGMAYGTDHPGAALSTLQEGSSNPSIAASAAAHAAAPPAVSGIPPVYTTPQPARRGILTTDLFIPPPPAAARPASTVPSTTAAPPSALDSGAWLTSGTAPDSRQVPVSSALATSGSSPAKALPYPFPAYSSSAPPPQPPAAAHVVTALPFPLTASAPKSAESTRPRSTQHGFPTPATTVTSLPFPLTQSEPALHERQTTEVPPRQRLQQSSFHTDDGSAGFSAPDEQAHVHASYVEDDHEDFEQGFDDVRSEDFAASSRAGSGSAIGSGSMSSLGQPIQTRYPFGMRRPTRGRTSSASGITTSVISAGSASFNGSGSGGGTGSGRPSVGSTSEGQPAVLSSASNSGYGVPIHRTSVVSGVRSQTSRLSRFSTSSGGAAVGEHGEYYYYEGPGEGEYLEEEEAGSGRSSSSPTTAGMAGVGAGGGIGPRESLIHLHAAASTSGRRTATSSSPTVTGQSPGTQSRIPPPPRFSGPSRRRAGTLPSLPSSPAKTEFSAPEPPMPSGFAAARTRVSSVPSPPSPSTRTYFPPPMPGFHPSIGRHRGSLPMLGGAAADSESDEEGSQEAAEREDSIGLLSAAPSPRNSMTGMSLRYRASNLSLQRRAAGARSHSLASSASGSSGADIRSRAASLISPVRTRRDSSRSPGSATPSSPGSSSPSQRSRASSLIPVPSIPIPPGARVRNDSNVRRSGASSSQYSDARSRTRGRDSSGTTSNSTTSGGAAPRGGDMTFGVQVDWSQDDAQRTQQPEATPRPPAEATAPSASGSRPLPIARQSEARTEISSADASFVTADPSMASESPTDTLGRSDSSGARAWTRRTSERYFVEGSQPWVPQ